ncbi:MAG: prohibitin family protein, partial [Xanthomonadales bacterium]|nr:prohibitin family protein [Xanthomonadales bacterium]MCB1575927.1 prohibitin family protein [Xanthomonadales bacterium]
ITVTQAKAQADSALAKAQAEAEAIRVRGIAEADAIKARGEALKQNAQLIALTQAEKWNGVLPATMVPGGTVPFLNLKANSGND